MDKLPQDKLPQSLSVDKLPQSLSAKDKLPQSLSGDKVNLKTRKKSLFMGKTGIFRDDFYSLGNGGKDVKNCEQ